MSRPWRIEFKDTVPQFQSSGAFRKRHKHDLTKSSKKQLRSDQVADLSGIRKHSALLNNVIEFILNIKDDKDGSKYGTLCCEFNYVARI